MTLPPLTGPLGDGFWVPDPVAYWFSVPVVTYFGAALAGWLVAQFIDRDGWFE